MGCEPIIIEENCMGCEECVEACPEDALKMVDGKAFFKFDGECTCCLICLEACEPEAIVVEES